MHRVKILPQYFVPVLQDRKLFEVRKNDRDYHVKDLIQLEEWTEEKGYTGRYIIKSIEYILDGGQYGIDKEYVVLGLSINNYGTNY